MRGLMVSVVVALSISGAALGAGWGLQAGVLPPAARADRIAADAAAWFLRYRLVAASFRLGGRRESSLCLRGWFPLEGGSVTRGILLDMRDGTRIADLGSRNLLVAEPPRLKPWRHLDFLLELAGCPTFLGKRVAGAAVDGTVGIARAYAAGRPALALHIGAHSPETWLLGRITVYVSARTDRPLAVAGVVGHVRGESRIRLTQATPRLLARVGAIPRPQTGRKP